MMGKEFNLSKGLEIIDGVLYMFRCPKCDTENYAMNVRSGICTWCGYDAHPDYQPRYNEQINTEDNGNTQ